MGCEAKAVSKVRGWKAIAAELEVSVRKAQELAQRPEGALPVRSDHGGIYVDSDTLVAWEKAQDKSYSERLEETRARRQAS